MLHPQPQRALAQQWRQTASERHGIHVDPKEVSPPAGGISSAYSMLALGGASRYDISVCHTASP